MRWVGWEVSSPAIVVVAVDVEDLLALDGEHSVCREAHTSACSPSNGSFLWYLPRENALGQTCRRASSVRNSRNSTMRWLHLGRAEAQPHIAGSPRKDIPVPSTMTSYSFAISSMIAFSFEGCVYWFVLSRV